MKKVILSGLFIVLAATFGQAQENFDKLPENAQEIIETNYAGHDISKIDIDKDSYEVKFENDTKIDFDKEGYPTEIKGEEKVPYDLLPEKMSYFLKNKYKNDYVDEWKMNEDGHKIEMKSGAELVFDKEGNLIQNKDLK